MKHLWNICYLYLWKFQLNLHFTVSKTLFNYYLFYYFLWCNVSLFKYQNISRHHNTLQIVTCKRYVWYKVTLLYNQLVGTGKIYLHIKFSFHLKDVLEPLNFEPLLHTTIYSPLPAGGNSLFSLPLISINLWVFGHCMNFIHMFLVLVLWHWYLLLWYLEDFCYLKDHFTITKDDSVFDLFK